MHFSQMWDSKWNMRRLLTHIVDVLITPDLALLPEKMMYILNLWLTSKGRDELHLEPSPLLVSEKVPTASCMYASSSFLFGKESAGLKTMKLIYRNHVIPHSYQDRPPTPPPEIAAAEEEYKKLREEAAKREKATLNVGDMPKLASIDDLRAGLLNLIIFISVVFLSW